jgi:hypothetical protein
MFASDKHLGLMGIRGEYDTHKAESLKRCQTEQQRSYFS